MEKVAKLYKKAIDLATNIDELNYIREKLYVTKHINRRTNKGRALEGKIREYMNLKAQELINNGETPF